LLITNQDQERSRYDEEELENTNKISIFIYSSSSSNLVLEQSFDQYHYHSMLIYTIDFYHEQVMDKVLENNQENLVTIPSHLINKKKRHRLKYI
jgi:hypothetical protein